MQQYLDKVAPNVSSTWRTDELYLKVKGNTKYLYAIMDDETRFWIARQIADTKFALDVRPLFRQAIRVAEKKPETLISDGAQLSPRIQERISRYRSAQNRTHTAYPLSWRSQ